MKSLLKLTVFGTLLWSLVGRAASAAQSAGTVGSDQAIILAWWLAPLGSILALVFAYVFFKMMKDSPAGTPRMIEIAQYVREGAFAYLYRQYKVVGFVFLLLVILFIILAHYGIQNPFVPVAFLTGGFFSGLCGFLNEYRHHPRIEPPREPASLNRGLQVAFRSGAVMGLVVVGFGLLILRYGILSLIDRLYRRAYGRRT